MTAPPPRPRDALGRPLGRGLLGVPPVPEEALPPALALSEAQRYWDHGRAFAAHEVLEATWKVAPAAERDLWQGLAQLAVGYTHLQRVNIIGGVRLLRRGSDRIRPWLLEPPYGIDVAGLLDWAEETTNLAEGTADTPPPAPSAPGTPPTPPPRLTSGRPPQSHADTDVE